MAVKSITVRHIEFSDNVHIFALQNWKVMQETLSIDDI